MVTARGWRWGGWPQLQQQWLRRASDTLHANKGSYLASVFDVAHDHGLSTALHLSKSKLVIIEQSYKATSGALDLTGGDDGRAKIDIVRYSDTNSDSGSLMDQLETDLIECPLRLTFLHLVDPDPVGHSSGWGSPDYLDALRRIDTYLGRLIELVEGKSSYAGRTTIILTADHGGLRSSHATAGDPETSSSHSTCGEADVPAKGDLYAINPATRSNPGAGRRSMPGANRSATATSATLRSAFSGCRRSPARRSMRPAFTWPQRHWARRSWSSGNCRQARCSCAGQSRPWPPSKWPAIRRVNRSPGTWPREQILGGSGSRHRSALLPRRVRVIAHRSASRIRKC